MRPREQVETVLALSAAGLGTVEIAARTGVPYSTVRKWRAGTTRISRGGHHCARCGGPKHTIPAAVERAYAYLLGIYLGDGWIATHRRGVYNLRIYLDERYPGIIGECRDAMARVLPASKVAVQPLKSRAVAVKSYSKAWPCLIPQHGPGVKHLRRIELADWQRAITWREPEAFVRGLIHSDGCRFTNPVVVRGKRYEYPRYTFTNVSDDIRALYCEHLDLLGIPWRRMNAINISVARRDAVARLDEFVGPKS